VKVCLAQIHFPEIRLAKVRLAEVHPAEVCSAEDYLAELHKQCLAPTAGGSFGSKRQAGRLSSSGLRAPPRRTTHHEDATSGRTLEIGGRKLGSRSDQTS
jgi:hypothetical protein